MSTLLAILCGFVLDLLLADPSWMPHPVVAMGKVITLLERVLRRIFPKTPGGELAAGVVLATVLPLGTLAVTVGVLRLCGLVHPALRFAVEVLWCWQAVAMRGLRDESCNVHRKLTSGTLYEARTAVGRIVGRDTSVLDAVGVTKAAVETVAENFADGVVAPLVYLAIGGAPLGLAYKAVNTMDSMVGYRNNQYLYFGRAAARLDDIANYLPARFAAVLLIISAAVTGQDSGSAWKIWRRDRRNHASPNSAQTEAAMAGALRVRLAGPAVYFGVTHHKPYIGDPTRAVETDDIIRANKMLYTAGLLCLAVVAAVRWVIILLH